MGRGEVLEVEDPLLERWVGSEEEGERDLEEIRSCGQFGRLWAEENKKMWLLAGPAIFTSLAQYSLGAITQVFAGHLTTLELDAVSTENNVVAGLALGIMLGMGSALETLCGQAFGAKQHQMLGVYMQRSWVILIAMSICMLPIYLFASPILRLFHQDEEIADLAGRFSLYMIPQLFAYALNFPMQKFLQAQSKVMAIMMCLEFWFLMILIVLVGNMKNAQVAVAAMSICMNLYGWEVMVFFGFNAAISVRVSNELGAGRPRAAKFSILVVVMSSILCGLVFSATVLVLRDVYGVPFTNSPHVVSAIADLASVFACTLLLNSVQPVLTGVAVGAGWQWLIAYVNLGCYYLVGIPVGWVLGFYLKFGVKGMWSGMLIGIGLQTLIIIAIVRSTNWVEEAAAAESRIRKWGGSVEGAPLPTEDDHK